MTNANWSQVEIDASVRQYLLMYDMQESGDEFNKAEMNRLLRTAELGSRSKGSVEYRMQNISAVMDSLGHEFLDGYKPARNVGSGVEAMIKLAIETRLRARQKLQIAQNVMRSIFASQEALQDLAPQYGWKGLGNLLGDFGEFVCTTHYSLDKASSGAAGYDATNPEGKTVQIKASKSSRSIGIRGNADLLLVIKVDDTARWNEVYYDDHQAVLDISRYSKRDNKHVVSHTKLRELADLRLTG